MSTAPTPTTDAAQPRRVKKRIYVPLVLLAFLLIGAVGMYVRGTWADTVEKNPAGAADGVVTQLLRQADGNVVIRSAVVVQAPPKEVWSAVTNYAEHHTFLPYVGEVKAVQQADGRFLLAGVTHSRLWGDWPFESTVTHVEVPADGRYSALWNELGGEDKDVFKINRGGWSISPLGDKDQSLLAFTIQVELTDYPNFVVRNIIMDRLPAVVKAMAGEAERLRKE